MRNSTKIIRIRCGWEVQEVSTLRTQFPSLMGHQLLVLVTGFGAFTPANAFCTWIEVMNTKYPGRIAVFCTGRTVTNVLYIGNTEKPWLFTLCAGRRRQST